jgi:2'-5' RNA ligase
VTPEARRAALVVVAAEHEPSVLEARRRWAGPDRRIPPHITILFPFVPAAELDDESLAAVARVCAAARPFEYVLASAESFPDAVWLAPDPAAPFVDLIARTREAFPTFPPYGDPAAAVPVPHCTVRVVGEQESLDRALQECRVWFRPHLPIRCRAEAVTLLEELDDGRWTTNRTFPLGETG